MYIEYVLVEVDPKKLVQNDAKTSVLLREKCTVGGSIKSNELLKKANLYTKQLHVAS
jgi:hypothetical protein